MITDTDPRPLPQNSACLYLADTGRQAITPGAVIRLGSLHRYDVLKVMPYPETKQVELTLISRHSGEIFDIFLPTNAPIPGAFVPCLSNGTEEAG